LTLYLVGIAARGKLVSNPSNQRMLGFRRYAAATRAIAEIFGRTTRLVNRMSFVT
jgi:hypothetical protein